MSSMVYKCGATLNMHMVSWPEKWWDEQARGWWPSERAGHRVGGRAGEKCRWHNLAPVLCGQHTGQHGEMGELEV